MESPQDTAPEKVVCGLCGDEFLTREEELAHPCPAVGGVPPTDPAHMGPEGAAIQEAALARGADRTGEEVHPAEAAAAEAGEPVNAPAEQAAPEAAPDQPAPPM